MFKDEGVDYPLCEKCGTEMTPVYFIDEEFVKGIATGRKRTAVSHFTCQMCFNNQCIDDTFDGQWHY